MFHVKHGARVTEARQVGPERGDEQLDVQGAHQLQQQSQPLRIQLGRRIIEQQRSGTRRPPLLHGQLCERQRGGEQLLLPA